MWALLFLLKRGKELAGLGAPLDSTGGAYSEPNEAGADEVEPMLAKDLAGRDAERDGREWEADMPVLVLKHLLRLGKNRGNRFSPLRVVHFGSSRLGGQKGRMERSLVDDAHARKEG